MNTYTVFSNELHREPMKHVALYFCPYLHQLLTDFQNYLIGTLYGQFAIM